MILALALALALAAVSTGCDQLGSAGWHPPANPASYGTWSHDPAVDNGCNEWDTEPAAEVDNDGNLCQSFVP